MNTIYCFSIFIVLGLSIVGTYLNKENNQKPTKIFLIMIILFLTIISGFRNLSYMQGDEYVYRLKFNQILNTGITDTNEKEYGFKMLIEFATRISSNSQILIFICAFITNILIIYTLYKYSNNFTISIFLYIAMGMYTTSFNIVRQYLAVAICFWAIRYVYEKKILKYILCIVVASTIHISCLILIPIYFLLCNKKIKNKYGLIFVISIIVTTFFDQFMILFFNSNNTNIYASYADMYFDRGKGVNIIRIIINVVPVLLMIRSKESLIRINEKNEINLFFSLISSAIYIVSYKFIYIARLAEYFCIFNLFTIPDLISIIKDKRTRQIICFTLCAVFFVFGFINLKNNIFYLGTWKINSINI